MESTQTRVVKVIEEFLRVNNYPEDARCVTMEGKIVTLIEDSLDWIELIGSLESEFDVDLDIDHFFDTDHTVGDVVEAIEGTLRRD